MDGERTRPNDRDNGQWDHWGPYLAERAWGTVREDYSPGGTAWDYFPHDHARSRVYRWSEDGIGGICDHEQFLCFALALWNGRDPILKERMFGLTNTEGNHGEDVKEYYYYLDNTPTHSYMRYLYKYPQAPYPYDQLIRENAARSREEREYELIDTGVFEENRYFDVEMTYAKSTSCDILIEITVSNRGPEAADITILPTLWFRNTWSWGRDNRRPIIRAGDDAVVAEHWSLGFYSLSWRDAPDEMLFTENETNTQRLYGTPPNAPYVKDAFHRYVVSGEHGAVNPDRRGTKAGLRYQRRIEAGQSYTLRLRLAKNDEPTPDSLNESQFSATLAQRKADADAFYASIIPERLSADAKNVARQAFAGQLWSKQYYHYVVAHWLDGDPSQPPPPPERLTGRNSEWRNVYCSDILAMPDKWEFPWFASWDLAFHCVTLELLDPAFAKAQVLRMGRSWYMRDNGQLPAYEWAFDDVNPPVLALAALRIYRQSQRRGEPDVDFLIRCFQKAVIAFTWWANRKDEQGNNIFQGGFLGLDNIGPFDRNQLPPGYSLGQVDGTSWMALFAATLFEMAFLLAEHEPAYEDIASKFRDHYSAIANAINTGETSLWDDTDGFFYERLRRPDGSREVIRARTAIGLIPLFEAIALGSRAFNDASVSYRGHWVVRDDRLPVDAPLLAPTSGPSISGLLVNEPQLKRILGYMFDPNEFYSDHGVRSVSRALRDRPVCVNLDGQERCVDYEPGESTTMTFGGNSNWRGPIWIPVNFLLLEALLRYGERYTSLKVECPVGSGKMRTLADAAAETARRIGSIFLRDADGRRPLNGGVDLFDLDPHWRDLVTFNEYFHGETGRGCGASHQTGWTSLVAPMLIQFADQFTTAAGTSNPTR